MEPHASHQHRSVTWTFPSSTGRPWPALTGSSTLASAIGRRLPAAAELQMVPDRRGTQCSSDLEPEECPSKLVAALNNTGVACGYRGFPWAGVGTSSFALDPFFSLAGALDMGCTECSDKGGSLPPIRPSRHNLREMRCSISWACFVAGATSKWGFLASRARSRPRPRSNWPQSSRPVLVDIKTLYPTFLFRNDVGLPLPLVGAAFAERLHVHQHLSRPRCMPLNTTLTTTTYNAAWQIVPFPLCLKPSRSHSIPRW